MLAVPALTSCELDQYPEGSIPAEQAWQTVKDAGRFNNGLLANLRTATEPAYAMIQEAQADLFNATTYNGNPPYTQTHSWLFNSDTFDGNAIWQAQYGLVSTANNILNNIDNIKPLEGADYEAELALLKKYKAIAYFARAYAYTQLVSGYCKNFDPATADKTLGLPLVTEVDVNAKPSRASLADTYKFIMEDLRLAKENFVDKENTDIIEPNYNAALALEARVALLHHDYQTAINDSKELMGKYSLITDADEFFAMWQNDQGSEAIYVPQQTIDELLGGYSAFINCVDVAGEGKYTAGYIPSKGLMSLYDEDDIRLSTYFTQTGIYANAEKEDPNGYILSKFPGNPDLRKGNAKYEFNNMVKVFRVAESYLIAAEAQYRLNGEGGEYLNQLRDARGAKRLGTVDGKPLTGNELFKAIKDEWAREMCGEGQRFMCLKRWNEGFTRMVPQNLVEGIIYTQNNVNTLTISPDNKRWVWELPSNELLTNKNLERNWPEQ